MSEAKPETNHARAVDRRRITLYAADSEERAELLREALTWAAKEGVPATRAFSRWAMHVLRTRPALKADTGRAGAPLEGLCRRLLEVWDADTYDHVHMGRTLEEMRANLEETK